MKELVTILLTTYNGQQYIQQMLDSIYLQDYRPIEVIIADDASIDKTVSIIKNWIKNKTKEHISFKMVLNKRNKGLSANMSNAIKYVHGKYLFLADQDDLWAKNKVSVQIEYLKKNIDCEMCICDRSAINSRNEIICRSLMRYEKINFCKRSYKDVLRNGSEYPANSICLRTSHLDKIFPIPNQICEHDTFIVIMAVHYGKVGYVRKSLTLYRIHNNNLSGNYAVETNKSFFKLLKIIVKTMKRINQKNIIDPIIIKKELKKRFNEDNIQFSTNMYSGKKKSIFTTLVILVLSNLRKKKNFYLS